MNKESFAEIPLLTPIGENGLISSELIYALEGRPTPQCHASTIAETPTGLVAAWFGGTRENNPDVGIWVSRHVNGKWQPPVEVVNGVQSMNLRYPCWNPVLFQPGTTGPEGSGNAPLLLFYKVGPSPREWWGMMTTSGDGGKSWSWPVKLGDDPAVGHLLGPVKNKPVQLADGTILCPSSTEYEGEKNDYFWRVHFEVTQDLGKTWKVIGPINDGVAFDAIQPSILTYPNGDMQILCRTKQNVISQSWSKDNGKTWEGMTATDLPNPNSGTDAVTLMDGRQLLVYNPTVRRKTKLNDPKTILKGRETLSVALSENGQHWVPIITLEQEASKAGFSYPAVIQADDGKIHITYTWHRISIKHIILDPEKLKIR